MNKSLTLALVSALALGLASHANAQWGTLKITFTLDGKAPAPKKLDVAKEPGCVKHDLVDETLTVGSNGGIKNVVVSLLSTGSTKVHPDVKAAASKQVTIDNHNCRFEPRVLVVTVNQPLVIKNSDPFGHNSKVTPFDNDPINPIIPAGGEYKHKFASTESSPTPIECNIHPWMKGYLVIRKDGYAGISDENGVVTIEKVPVGEHNFSAWCERNLEGVKIGGKDAGWKKGKFKAKIEDGKTTELKVAVAPEVILKGKK